MRACSRTILSVCAMESAPGSRTGASGLSGPPALAQVLVDSQARPPMKTASQDPEEHERELNEASPRETLGRTGSGAADALSPACPSPPPTLRSQKSTFPIRESLERLLRGARRSAIGCEAFVASTWHVATAINGFFYPLLGRALGPTRTTERTFTQVPTSRQEKMRR